MLMDVAIHTYLHTRFAQRAPWRQRRFYFDHRITNSINAVIVFYCEADQIQEKECFVMTVIHLSTLLTSFANLQWSFAKSAGIKNNAL